MKSPSPAALAASRDGYMTGAEVRAHLAIGVRSLNTLVRADQIEAVGYGRGKRYTRSSVLRYAARRLMTGL